MCLYLSLCTVLYVYMMVLHAKRKDFWCENRKSGEKNERVKMKLKKKNPEYSELLNKEKDRESASVCVS